MKMTGAEALLKILEGYGVKHIFGYPGGAVLPLYDAILNNPNIEHILVRSEQAGAHAAAAYGKYIGQSGVCIGTSGPGATNLVTGIANAYMDSIPLLAITGQVDSSFIGRDAFQEADITGITMPIVKHNYLVKDPKKLVDIIYDAWHIANTGRKGPVLIDIPRNVFEATVDFEPRTDLVKIKGYKPTYEGHQSQIKKAVKMINSSFKPLLLVGGGVNFSKAEKEVVEFVEKYNIPMATTLMGIGTYDETKDLALGMIGMHGMPYANYAVHHCDLLIAVGTRFGDRATGSLSKFAKDAKIIHIDIDPAEIGKNVLIDLPIVGDAKSVLSEILLGIEIVERNEWLEKIIELKSRNRMLLHKTALNPQLIIQKLGDMARDDILIATDVGQHQMFAAQYFKFSQENSLYTSGGLGTMGFGLPAAEGVALAAGGKKQVFCITGDGSFQMNMAEMATIVEHNLPVKILLLNNSSLCLVKQLQHFQCDKRFSEVSFTGNPDFSAMARSYPNMTAYRIENEDEIESVLKEAMSHNGPSLIECIISDENLVYPIVPAKKGLAEMIGVEKW
ncbi:MAG: biosynthetic-type acetolactate synthase large subunit [Firmicutes bacterium]|nr:biosynthetic-type acetolactate synthase large subunit [Bacillota bacterium]